MIKKNVLLSEPIYNENEKKQLLEWARVAIETYLQEGWVIQAITNNQMLKRKVGIFVTLWKSNELRGCIGLMETDKPLNETVVDMAIEAAVKDNRFKPLVLNELPEIKIEISILSPLHKIKNIQEIELDKHGVMIIQGKKSGVFLPEVAKRENWDLGTMLEALCIEKAGLPANAWMEKNSDIYIFTSTTFREK
ncbi:MAG TPA: AmmeMemoRadiSam system protein A [Candidatus Magasanikbacteria bacterium]|nr:AmmeMemoRadiSam system protein A [Candidatus Magasanikbacteria bacterium]